MGTIVSDNKARKTRALMIGISEYNNLPKEKQLKYADADALAFYHFLTKRPDIIRPEDMVIILNEEASKREYVESLLENFIVHESKPGDMVILFFSGHAAIQNPDATVDQGYLLLHNAPDDGDYAAPSSDVISINFLQELITKVNDDVDVLFIIDACHSGKIINQSSNNEKVMIALQNKWEDTYKFSACQSNQLSLEGPQWGNGHGVFTYHLLFGLCGMADLIGNKDNNLMFEEIYDYVKTNVKKDTEYKQLPRFDGDGSVNFISVDKNQQQQAIDIISNIEGDMRPMLAMTVPKGINYFYNIPVKVKSDFDSFMELVSQDKLIPSNCAVFPEFKNVHAKLDVVNQSYKPIEGINRIEFADNGDYLLVYNKDQVVVFNSNSKKKSNTFNRSGLNNILIKGDNTYLVLDQTIEKWQTDSNIIGSIRTKVSGQFSAISESGKLIAISDGTTIEAIETESLISTGRQIDLSDMEIDYLTFQSDSVLLFTDKNNHLINYDIRNNLLLNRYELNENVVSIKPIPLDNRILIVYDNKSQVLKMDGLIKEWETYSINSNVYQDVTVANYPHILLIQSKNKVGVYNAFYEQITSELRITDDISMVATGGPYYAILMDQGDIYLSRIMYSGKKILVEKEPSAYPYFQKMMANYGLHHLHNRLKNYYLAELINYANQILEPFISGDVPENAKTNLLYASQCLDLAEVLNMDSQLVAQKIELSSLLISIYSELIEYNYDNYQKALAKLSDLIISIPDASFNHNMLSGIYLRLNEILEAQTSSTRAMNNNPFWSEPRLSYARSLIKNREYHEALDTLDRVILQFPESRNAYLLAGDVYLFLGNLDKATSYYSMGDSIYRDTYSESKKAQAFILGRRYSNAITIIESAIARYGSNPYASLMLGKIYLHIYFESQKDQNINSNNFQQAVKYLQESYNLGSESSHVCLEYLKMTLAEFTGILKQASNKNSSSSPGRPFSIGDFKSRVTQDANTVYENQEEIKIFLLSEARNLLKKDPYYYPTYKLIADILAMMGKTDEAIEMFDLAILENPDVADLYYFKGMFVSEIDKPVRAKPYFEIAIQKDINFLPAYFSLLQEYTVDKKGKLIDINKTKNKEVKNILNQARAQFGNDIFKNSKSIRYSKAVPYFFDQIYFY